MSVPIFPQNQVYWDYLKSKPESLEDYPFGPDVAVMKIHNKMFATFSRMAKTALHDAPVDNMNLKCDPDEALALRDIFSSVVPGYHMNKKHWNTLYLDGSIPEGEIFRMIDKSYGLVVKSLKKEERQALEIKYGKNEIYK